MYTIIFLVIFILFLFFPLLRCALFNIHLVGIYSIRDVYMYFKLKKWKDFNYFGIDMYCGMFGHGKTLSIVHKASQIYNKFGDSVRFISNIDLSNIPYIPLVNFNQLVDLGENDNDFIGTVVIIDEVENVLNNRNFAKFPLSLMHLLTQQRKKRVFILCSAQRFFMVDKLFRSITTRVIDCNKFWRFQTYSIFDAWEYENAVNPKLIKPYSSGCFFVNDSDYLAYNTSEMVSKTSAENFISNIEVLEKQGVIVPLGDSQIMHPSRTLRRRINSK